MDSILNQTIEENKYEIIAVNDGSTDNSLSIVKEYKKNHNNIHIVNQENGGVAFARNKGIDCAKGDWIIFIDSDDWIGEQTLNKLYEYLEKYDNSDIIVLNSFYSDSKEKIFNWTNIVKENECYDGSTIFIKYNHY